MENYSSRDDEERVWNVYVTGYTTKFQVNCCKKRVILGVTLWSKSWMSSVSMIATNILTPTRFGYTQVFRFSLRYPIVKALSESNWFYFQTIRLFEIFLLTWKLSRSVNKNILIEYINIWRRYFNNGTTPLLGVNYFRDHTRIFFYFETTSPTLLPQPA